MPPAAPGRLVLPALAALAALLPTACVTVRPGAARAAAASQEGGSPPRSVPADVAARYVGVGPMPRASTTLRRSEPGFETWDVVLPARLAASAPDDEPAPTKAITMRWWRPLPVGGRRPAVVLSPILGGPNLLVGDFARAFAGRGWHALVVDREDLGVDRTRTIAQVEDRSRDEVSAVVQALDWLLAHEDVDPRRIGSLGISAGGIQTTMVAGADPRYAAHVIALAGGPLADVLVDSSERMLKELVAKGMAAEGVGKDELRERLRATIETDPLPLAHNVAPEKVLFVMARRDVAVPTRCEERLYDALGRPETIVLPFGHYSSAVFLPFVACRAVAFLDRRFAESAAATPSPATALR